MSTLLFKIIELVVPGYLLWYYFNGPVKVSLLQLFFAYIIIASVFFIIKNLSFMKYLWTVRKGADVPDPLRSERIARFGLLEITDDVRRVFRYVVSEDGKREGDAA